jgi:hypothetical protein
VLVSKPSWNLKDTHKSWWECDTGIAYLVSGVDGWRSRRMTEVFDLSDPAKPVKIRDFGLVGQEPGTSGTVPTDLHGMISTGPAGQSHLLRLRHQQGRRHPDRRPRQATDGPKEPTPDNLAHPIVRQSRPAADHGRAHHRAAARACRLPNSPRTRTARCAISS